MILATYDGFYLHIFKYGLFNYKESKFEHQIHTVRAILFPLILYTVFLNEGNSILFITGMGLFILDLIVLGIDAYAESESRSFMGGLPKWEYILHLFSNSFHFAAVLLVLALKIDIKDGSLLLLQNIPNSVPKDVFLFVSVNMIPGAIILAFLHLFLLMEAPKALWNNYRSKIICC